MASRPLPPGRRGRAPRTASGLHNLPQAVLLEAADAPPDNNRDGSLSSAIGTHPLETMVTKSYAAAPPRAHSPTPSDTLSKTLDSAEESHAAKPELTTPEAASAFAPAIKEVDQVEHEPEARHVEKSACESYHPNGRASEIGTVDSTTNATQEQVEVALPAIRSGPVPVAAEVITNPVPAAATIPVQQAAVAAPRTPARQVKDADLGGFHPFHLLFPVDAVPDVPETIECIYDDAAVEMQKHIMKVVKKLLGRDKMKLEDFKINSRLFGNNFMEAYEYLDSLVKDFGGVRALQLVPCLLMLQEDFMKRSGLLLAARNYRMRNIASLEMQCQQTRAAELAPSPASAHADKPVASCVSEMKQEAVKTVETVSPLSVETDLRDAGSTRVEQHQSILNTDAGKLPTVITTPDPAPLVESAFSDSIPLSLFSQEETPPCIAPAGSSSHGTAEDVIESVGVSTRRDGEVQGFPNLGYASPVAQPALSYDSELSESKVEEAAVDLFSPVVASDASASSVAGPPFLVEAASVPVAEQSVESAHNDDVQAETLVSSNAASSTQEATTESDGANDTSSNNSFAEAESLFGERSSSGSISDSVENLFGESFSRASSSSETAAIVPVSKAPEPSASEPASSTAAPSPPAPKRVHSQLLFGFATAGADTDSDSDDSGFSSS